MKIITIQLLILSVMLIGCSKTESIPDPYVELTIGTRTTGYMVGFVPFKSQDTIEYSQLDTIELTMYKKWQIRMYKKQQLRMSIFSI